MSEMIGIAMDIATGVDNKEIWIYGIIGVVVLAVLLFMLKNHIDEKRFEEMEEEYRKEHPGSE